MLRLGDKIFVALVLAVLCHLFGHTVHMPHFHTPVAKGLRVLLVIDPLHLDKMPPLQLAGLQGAVLTNYLDKHCVKEAHDQPGWRLMMKGEPVEKESKMWQDAYAIPPTGYPWMVVFDGKKVLHKGLFPANGLAAVNLLEKYGGE